MKSWKVLIVIALVLLTISWVIVTPEKKSFSVLSQRVVQQQIFCNNWILGWSRFFCRYDLAV